MLISAGKMLIYGYTNILVDEVIVIWATKQNKTFVLNSDDLWEALHEEEQKIEEFFEMRRKK
mgnify:CR=1 FL=1